MISRKAVELRAHFGGKYSHLKSFLKSLKIELQSTELAGFS